MKKLIYLLPIVATLGACATVPNELHQNEVFGAASAYGITQKLATLYGALQYCAKGTTTTASNYCQDPKIEVKIATANAKVSIARKGIENFVRDPKNYPGLTYGQLLATFNTAVQTLQQIEAENGVHA